MGDRDNITQSANLINELRQIAHNNNIIVVFGNSAYQDIVYNWLESTRRLALYNTLVIATDEALYESLKHDDQAVIFRRCSNELQALWHLRALCVHELLSYGFNVLHTDADAVMLKNPFELPELDGEDDLIFSQGTVWPNQVHDAWGFVLCCGFYFARAKPKVISFFEMFAERTAIEGDDQKALNFLLLEAQTVWNQQRAKTIQHQGMELLYFDDYINGSANGLKLGLLPLTQFQRFTLPATALYMVHMLSEKNPESTAQALKDCECWFLN